MFKCSGCGNCCRNLDKSDLYFTLHAGDGVCKFLIGNSCSIYKDRPLLCKVDEFYEEYLSDKITLKDYYDANYKMCLKFKMK